MLLTVPELLDPLMQSDLQRHQIELAIGILEEARL